MSAALALGCYSTVERGLDDDVIVATITTSSRDRTGDEVIASGIDYRAFLRNPVVLWSHDYSIPPIGKCVDLRLVGDKLVASTKHADTAMGREVFGLYRGGFMSTYSIGFRPLVSEPIKGGGTRYLRSELLEYSAVPVPANAEAVIHRHAEPLDAVRKRLAALERDRGLPARPVDPPTLAELFAAYGNEERTARWAASVLRWVNAAPGGERGLRAWVARKQIAEVCELKMR